jgi:hypothetical protein
MEGSEVHTGSILFHHPRPSLRPAPEGTGRRIPFLEQIRFAAVAPYSCPAKGAKGGRGEEKRWEESEDIHNRTKRREGGKEGGKGGGGGGAKQIK